MRSFAEVYPDLVREWSPENALTPDEVSFGSNKPIIWNGSCGHIWTASAKNRGHGHGCPICSGNLIRSGVNDFASRYPDMAREWSDRNHPKKPEMFAPKSNQSFWWTCRTCGLEWKARIADRTDGHGCPFCLRERVDARIKRRKADKEQRRQVLLRERSLSKSLKDSAFRMEAISFYAELAGITVVHDHDCGIGIPVQLFFPEKCAAIELTSHLKEGWKDWRYENAKNWLCLRSGILLIRIIPQKEEKFENCKCVRLKNESAEALNYTLTQVFKRLKIPMDIDVLRDYDKIRRYKEC